MAMHDGKRNPYRCFLYKLSMDPACTEHDTKSILLLIPSIGQKWTRELWLMNIKIIVYSPT